MWSAKSMRRCSANNVGQEGRASGERDERDVRETKINVPAPLRPLDSRDFFDGLGRLNRRVQAPHTEDAQHGEVDEQQGREDGCAEDDLVP